MLNQALQPVASDVGIDLGSRDIGVAEHLLHAAQIRAAVDEMAGKSMAQDVGRQSPRIDAGLRRDGPGGVLVKAEKPGQEKRADRPTIGPQTVALAAAGGLRGIAAQAGATLVLDRAEVVRLADEASLFVIGVRPERT